MRPYGVMAVKVSREAIDVNGHVSNIQYVAWMQEAAMAHSASLGWPQERYASMDRTWIIRSHAIEYLRPAFLGDEISVYTWVADFRKIRSLRKFKFYRERDETVLATASTGFVFCAMGTGRPCPIPEEVRAAYPVVADEDVG